MEKNYRITHLRISKKNKFAQRVKWSNKLRSSAIDRAPIWGEQT